MQYYETSTELLRITADGNIEQYDEKLQKWRSADSGMSGIYCGAIECRAISKEAAEAIIARWNDNAGND